MSKIIIFAVSFFAVNAAWAQQASTAAPSTPTETITADNVPIEEYVPKVIIEGRWGTGPGEFGAIDPMQAEYFGVAGSPASMAVNSKGEIYVLDHLNNRIQKFSSDGKFATSITIPSCGDDKGINIVGIKKLSTGGARFSLEKSPAIIGISVVIDSKDTLYYYLKRVKNGKETGEVWEFKGDKLVKKYSSAQKGGLPVKFQLASVGYNQFALTVAEPPTASEKPKYHVSIKKDGANSQIFVEDNGKKMISKIEIPPAAEYTAAQARHGRAKSDVYFEKMLGNGNFRVRTVNGDVHTIVTEEREYTPEGKLVRRVKSPHRYSHALEVGETGIKVVHWVMQKGN